MALLTAANLRQETLDASCVQLALNEAEASDALLTSVISNVTRDINDWTNDLFETTALTILVDGTHSTRLRLPYRTTAVSSVKLLQDDGTLSAAQAATTYVLHSSLDSTGARAVGHSDWLDTVSTSNGFVYTSLNWELYRWPSGTRSVQVIGSFGYTITPPPIKRACALMVWDAIKTKRPDLRAAESVTNNQVVVRYTAPDPDNRIWTGISDVDRVIAEYQRSSSLVA